MNLKLSAVLLSAAAVILPANANTPQHYQSYIKSPNPCKLILNNSNLIDRFFNQHKAEFPNAFNFPDGCSTLQAEIRDFIAATGRYCKNLKTEDQLSLLFKYEEFVIRWRKDTNIPLSEYPELPEALSEFKLYIEGLHELLKSPKLTTVPAAWQKLLALPAEKRHFRTAWVYFMLGNHFKAECQDYYDKCREAVRSGFADTPGLARRSYILEMRYGKDPVRVLRRAAEASGAVFELSYLVHKSQKEINAFDDSIYDKIIQDPVTRELMAIMDTSPRFEKMTRGMTICNADVRAFYAMKNNNIALARHYISTLPEPTLLSLILEAHLAWNSNDFILAERKLKQWQKIAGKHPLNIREALFTAKEPAYLNYYHQYKPMASDVCGMLGAIALYQRNIPAAAEYFYKGQISVDLSITLESFMTLDELVKFVDSIAAVDNNDHNFSQADIRNLLARRAFREGRMDIAKKYTTEKYRQLITGYQALLARSQDSALDADSRALALYNAAKILRHEGMELCGTQNAPDFYPGYFGLTFPRKNEFDGTPNCKDGKCSYNAVTGNWSFCRSHRNDYTGFFNCTPGFNALSDYNTVPKHQRFHYRYRAAGMAWRAAEMAKDSDLKALILLFGGSCLKLTSPQEANVFYRKLVRQCYQTPLGQLANRRKWFPKIQALENEIKSSLPCPDMATVKQLMLTAFPPSPAK